MYRSEDRKDGGGQVIDFLQKGFERGGLVQVGKKRKGGGERIEWIDAIKGVGIVLVVFCHYVILSEETIIGNFFMTLAWAAVPCFMMASGAMMHQSRVFDWRRHFLKVWKVYGTLCAWRLIYLVVYVKLQNVQFGRIQLVQYLFLLTDLDGVDTGVMWYMEAYLTMLLIFPISRFLFCEKIQGEYKGRRVLLYVMFLSMMGSAVLPSVGWGINLIGDFLQIGRIDINRFVMLIPFVYYGNLLFYFFAGAFVFEYRDWVKRKLGKYKAALFPLMCMGTGGLMLVKYVDSGLISWGGVYLSEGYSHVLTELISIAFFLLFMAYEDEWYFLNHFLARHIGRYTMGIYYLHYILLAACSIYFYPMIHKYYSFMANGIKTVLVTLVCVVVTMLLKKIPWVRNLV